MAVNEARCVVLMNVHGGFHTAMLLWGEEHFFTLPFIIWGLTNIFF